MADIFRDQDHNLNKIVNADLTLIDPFLLPTGVLLSQDVLGATGIVVIDNGDGTVTIGSSAPTGPLVGYIDDLSDVDTSTTGPLDGQVLLWDATLQQWVPGEQAGGLGYRERFNVVDPATQLPLRVVHGLDVVTGVVDVTVAEMGPPTRLVQAEVTIIDENTIDVQLLGVTTGSFEVLVLAEGKGGPSGPSGPQQLLDEVFVGATDPYVTDPQSTAELWYTPLGATYPVGPTGPDIPTGVLRASVNGVWEIVGGVAGIDDLTDVDTATTGPTGGNALVWDETVSQWVPGTVGIQFWESTVNYDIDDMVLWPETAPSSLWKASAANIDEEPTPSTTVEPDGIVFGGAAAGLSAGYRANTPKLASAGFEVRIQTDGTIGTGTLIAAGPAGSTLFKVQTGTNPAFLQIVLPIGVGFTNDRAIADFPSLNHIKIKVTGSTFNWYSSADGVEWTEVGTTMPNNVGIGPGEFLWISVGNDQGSDVNQNYAGVLRAVEIYNVDGTAPLTSWVRATQPDALGTGVSAKTGEIWDIYDPNGVMLDDPLPGTPSSWVQLIGGAGSIDDLTDVDTSTTGPTGGNALIWDETVNQWVPGVASTVASLDDLTDVTTSSTGPTGPTGPTHGQALTWDETLGQWVPGPATEAEVEVGPTAPTAEWELWVDTSALKPPPGVSTSNFLPVTGGIMTGDVVMTDDVASVTFGDSKIYKPASAAGMRLRMGSGQVGIQIEDNTGANASPILTELTGWKSWSGSQAEYDAIPTKDPNCLYAII